MACQIYAAHHGAASFHMVTSTPLYEDLFASARFCLAPSGGGYGKRQVMVRAAAWPLHCTAPLRPLPCQAACGRWCMTRAA